MEHYEQAVAVIKKDCHITGKLWDDKGRTCAVGALMLSLEGVTLTERGFHKGGADYATYLQFEDVQTYYSLSGEDMLAIVNANNGVEKGVRARRRAVLAALEKINRR